MGDVEDAICLHAFYYAIWKRYGALPERYNWQLQAPDVLFYPLRPELVESTYLLYQVLRLLSPRPRGGLSSSLLPAAGLCCSVVTLTGARLSPVSSLAVPSQSPRAGTVSAVSQQ